MDFIKGCALNWLEGWALVGEGVARIFTLGVWRPTWSLKSMQWSLDWEEEMLRRKRIEEP